jgi:hypothetical protein
VAILASATAATLVVSAGAVLSSPTQAAYVSTVTDTVSNGDQTAWGTTTTAAYPATNSYAKVVMGDNPVDFWQFEDDTGDSLTVDDSVGTRPLKLFGAQANLSQTGASALRRNGVTNHAGKFVGASGYSHLATQTTYALTTDMGLEGWIYHDPAYTGGVFAAFSSTNSTSGTGVKTAAIIYISDEGRLCVSVANAGTGTRQGDCSGTTFVNDSVWHHIAFSWNNSSSHLVRVYIDGQRVIDFSTTYSPALTGYVTWGWGNIPAGLPTAAPTREYMLANVDFFGFYNKGLSEAVVKDHWHYS